MAEPTHDEDRRKFAEAEILLSERSYVRDLRATMTAFIAPLQANAKSDAPVLSQDEWFVMFKQFEPILLLAEVILQALEEEASAGTGSIGQIFQDLSPFLRMYISYVNAHSAASELHAELLDRGKRNAEGQTAYSAFLDECAAANQEALKGRLLTDLLIMPIQRIPRYRLLLEELIKRSPAGDEVDSLEKGLASISDVANMINTSLHEFENRNAIVRVQAEFGNQQVFVAPHRKFVKEGTLSKMCRKGPRPYRLVLFSDLLVYGVEDELAMAKVTQKYRFKQKFVLAQCKLTKESETSFSIASPNKSFVVLGPDAATTLDWVDRIEAALAEAAASSASEAEEELVHAPVWVPDKAAPNCSNCQAAFTLFKRRHHCRRCGNVVCDKCSPHRWYLPHIDATRAQRMCNNCYLEVRQKLAEDDYSAAGQADLPRPGPPPPEKKPRVQPKTAGATVSAPSAASASREEPAGDLPRNWRQLRDDAGKVYYWNVVTDGVSYERPSGKVGQWRPDALKVPEADEPAAMQQPLASPLKKTLLAKLPGLPSLSSLSGAAAPAANAKPTPSQPQAAAKPAAAAAKTDPANKSPARGNAVKEPPAAKEQPSPRKPVTAAAPLEKARPKSVKRPSMVAGVPLADLLARYEQQGKFGQTPRFTAAPLPPIKEAPQRLVSVKSPTASSLQAVSTPAKTPVVSTSKRLEQSDAPRPVSMRVAAVEKKQQQDVAASSSSSSVDRRSKVPHRNLYADGGGGGGGGGGGAGAGGSNGSSNASPANSSRKPLANDLGDAEFKAVFGKSKAEFAKMPAWQQIETKSQRGYL